MNKDEVIKKLQIKNGKLQIQIERLKLDKEEYYLDYLNLQQRIDKTTKILEMSALNKGICTTNEIDTIQKALDILRGDE